LAFFSKSNESQDIIFEDLQIFRNHAKICTRKKSIAYNNQERLKHKNSNCNKQQLKGVEAQKM